MRSVCVCVCIVRVCTLCLERGKSFFISMKNTTRVCVLPLPAEGKGERKRRKQKKTKMYRLTLASLFIPPHILPTFSQATHSPHPPKTPWW